MKLEESVVPLLSPLKAHPDTGRHLTRTGIHARVAGLLPAEKLRAEMSLKLTEAMPERWQGFHR